MSEPNEGPATQPGSAATLPPIRALHHTAFRCFDAEQTRAFYEDVLGLPLAAALVIDEAPGTGRPFKYMHLFFRMADDNFVAFFDLPDDPKPDHYKAIHGFDLHFAFRVEGEAEMMAYKRRLEDAAVDVRGPIDHHFVRSIYFLDPNGIQVEVTTPTPRHDAILAEDARTAHAVIRDWSAARTARLVAPADI